MATKEDVKKLKRDIPLFNDVMGFAEDYTGETASKRKRRKHKS